MAVRGYLVFVPFENVASYEFGGTSTVPGSVTQPDKVTVATTPGHLAGPFEVREVVRDDLPPGIDYTALTGKFQISIVRTDGTEDIGYPAIAADGTWRYHVPAGVRLAGMKSVSAGDIVSGKLELSEW